MNLSDEASFQKTGGNQAGWVWHPHQNIKRVLIRHIGKGRSLAALTRNVLIITLYNATNLFHTAIKAVKRSGGSPAEKMSQLSMVTIRRGGIVSAGPIESTNSASASTFLERPPLNSLS